MGDLITHSSRNCSAAIVWGIKGAPWKSSVPNVGACGISRKEGGSDRALIEGNRNVQKQEFGRNRKVEAYCRPYEESDGGGRIQAMKIAPTAEGVAKTPKRQRVQGNGSFLYKLR